MLSETRMRVLVFAGVLACSDTGQAQVVMEWVTIGDPGNTDHNVAGGYGGVDYLYNIGKYEVTNNQYCEMLNAVAGDDSFGLYNDSMASAPGGITRSGSPGSYVYTPIQGRGDMPVNFVSWKDAARFANWLHNGQPTGTENSSTTENGAYQVGLGFHADRKSGARVFLPSRDEWYKAAFYKGGGTNSGYWDYPTKSSLAPRGEVPPGTDRDNGSANHSNAVGDLTAVGAYNGNPSDGPYGTFDQAGNVWEWNEGVSSTSSSHGIGGGSFADPANFMNVSPLHHFDTDGHAYFGFRVASPTPPVPAVSTWGLGAMMLLLLSAGTVVAIRRKDEVAL